MRWIYKNNKKLYRFKNLGKWRIKTLHIKKKLGLACEFKFTKALNLLHRNPSVVHLRNVPAMTSGMIMKDAKRLGGNIISIS